MEIGNNMPLMPSDVKVHAINVRKSETKPKLHVAVLYNPHLMDEYCLYIHLILRWE